jgi:dGTPase
MSPTRTRGRRHPEPEHAYRSVYARDRDRIIHCRAFRRLEYKTQVFVNHEGDHYRTRLTHSLEVSQIGRTVARALGLNPQLVEALCLSHDLGHAPFGHLGEDVLDPLMKDDGGFDHNHQTLRIVERLEERYPDFVGLNLTWELREGIVKHSGMPDAQRGAEYTEYDPEIPPPLEAQLIDLVDEIAYNHHDIDDGLESGLLELESLVEEVPLFGEPYRTARDRHPETHWHVLVNVALRGLIGELVTDLIDTTRKRIEMLGIASVDDVRACPEPMVAFSPEVGERNIALKRFLSRNLYQHPRIEATKAKAAAVLRALFQVYRGRPEVMPAKFARRGREEGMTRSACDYLAGMTDRYVIDEYRRLVDPSLPPRDPLVAALAP